MADRATVSELVKFIGQYHGRTIGAEAVGVYVEAFADTGADLLADAIKRWCDTHAPSALLPSVQDLRVCCRDIIAARRGGEKRDTPGPSALGGAQRRARPGIARATAELVRRSRLAVGHPERLDGKGLVAEMRRLDGEFPNCGWWDAATALAKQRAADAAASDAARRRYVDLGMRLGRGFLPDDAEPARS